MIRYDEMVPMIRVEAKRRCDSRNSQRWHVTEERCPKCGFRLFCDGVDLHLCNRCGHEYVKDVRKDRKYRSSGKHQNQIFGYGRQSA
jgi:DNA-directed RNA polymerase subunit RPC12/RpoP